MALATFFLFLCSCNLCNALSFDLIQSSYPFGSYAMDIDILMPVFYHSRQSISCANIGMFR